MAATHRQPTAGVIAGLLSEARAFSFFQVVRLLEDYCGGSSLGGTDAAGECIRLRPSPELVFPRSGVESVEAVEHEGDRPRFRVTANFLGLYGTTSPLPNFFSEEILRFDEPHDGARDLLDLINHRLLSLFYRAWTKYRYAVRWQAGGSDELSATVFALCGLAETAMRDKVGVPAVRLLRYAGLLTQAPRSAAALRGILGDYFDGIPCAVQQCVLRWAWLEEEDQWILGRRNGRLGQSATLGLRVPDRSGKFRIGFGPMDLETYLTFLPRGPRFAAAVAIARLVARDNLTFDVEARLRNDEIPPPILTQAGAPRLGWTSWLDRGRGDDGVVVFHVPAEELENPNQGEASP